MTAQLAIGIGCRKGCSGAAITALVRCALSQTEGSALGLFSAEEKRDEQGLVAAAAALGLPLAFLPRARLEAAAARCATRSARVEELFGLPSIAEAAALAGAGEASRLVLARISAAGASCAIARQEKEAP